MSAVVHVASHPQFKLGLKPPGHPKLLHFNTIKRVAAIDTSSTQPFDYTTGLPDNMGALFNDQYGCCTAAAKGHRFQATTMLTKGTYIPGDSLQDAVLNFYSATTGFNPSAPLNADGENPTDQGGNMQDIAEYLVKTGMTMPDGSVDRFVAAFMIDPSNVQDLIYCGRECVGIDLGVIVTTNVMPQDGSSPPTVWQAGGEQVGGHDIFALGALPNGNLKVNSWGGWYQLTPGFLSANCNTVVAYVSADALKDGKTVLNLAMDQWQNAMTGHYADAA
jgi:hypothetical protein